MTPQQIVGLGVRLFAIWLALQAAPWVAQLLRGTNDPVTAPIVPGILISAAAYVGTAVVIWNIPMWIAHKLIPRTAHENVLNLPLFDAARVGCALIGLWLLATTLQNIVWFFITALIASGSGSVFAATSKENKIALALDIFQVGLGLFLLFRSQWFAKFVSRPESSN